MGRWDWSAVSAMERKWLERQYPERGDDDSEATAREREAREERDEAEEEAAERPRRCTRRAR